ncbi:MAG: hypothetical protein RIA69_07035 [Cyclobacteriaceae bacterium]
MTYYVVKYTGPFGFIKPWTAVRDSETFSQQFLTPSIVEGIEKKLFPELLSDVGIKRIVGHRLSYAQVSGQQEVIQTRGWNSKRQSGQILFDRPKAILIRGVLQNPVLHLAFEKEEYAINAYDQHLCLCRNEDMIFPKEILEGSKEEFETSIDRFPGYELVFEKNDKSFLVGYHRYTGEPMYGWIRVVGQPITTF